jgi:hypothetical protein
VNFTTERLLGACEKVWVKAVSRQPLDLFIFPFCRNPLSKKLTLFPTLLLRFVVAPPIRACKDLRFCYKNINRAPEDLTLRSNDREYRYENQVFRARLIANGAESNLILLISKITSSGLRIRVDPGINQSSYRYNIAREDFVVNDTNLNTLDDIFVTNGTDSLTIATWDNVLLEITRNPFVISV